MIGLIRSGLDNNALSFLIKNEKYLSSRSFAIILYRAAIHGALNVLKFILYSSDYRYEITNNALNWAIRYASEYGHLEIIEMLFKDDRVIEIWSDCIFNACRKGHTKIVRLMLQDKRINPTKSNNSAVMLTIKNNHLEIVRLLLADKRINPNFDQDILFRTICTDGNSELVKLCLLDKRFNPSIMHNYSIRIACENGHLDVVKILLTDQRTDPTECLCYSLNMARKNKHNHVIDLLMEMEIVKIYLMHLEESS